MTRFIPRILIASILIVATGACSSVPGQYGTNAAAEPERALTLDQDLGFAPDQLLPGRGFFRLSGGEGRENNAIQVHYFKPDEFDRNSPILIVIPGAGRNSDDYRDSWVDIAQRKNVLVAALGYAEADYDFAAYQLAGIAEDLTLNNPRFEQSGPNARVLRMADEDIQMAPNADRDGWIFSDFDHVFEFLVSVTGSKRSGYDIFGHSAGGQILHRLAVFHPTSRAERIIAGNAGFYTLPDLSNPPPVGVEGTGLAEHTLTIALSAPLVLLLGEEDNSDSAGGTLLHTPIIDQQGLGRLDRGRYFFEYGQRLADKNGVPFNWKLKTVPGVGHNYRAMGQAAGALLYDSDAQAARGGAE